MIDCFYLIHNWYSIFTNWPIYILSRIFFFSFPWFNLESYLRFNHHFSISLLIWKFRRLSFISWHCVFEESWRCFCRLLASLDFFDVSSVLDAVAHLCRRLQEWCWAPLRLPREKPCAVSSVWFLAYGGDCQGSSL